MNANKNPIKFIELNVFKQNLRFFVVVVVVVGIEVKFLKIMRLIAFPRYGNISRLFQKEK